MLYRNSTYLLFVLILLFLLLIIDQTYDRHSREVLIVPKGRNVFFDIGSIKGGSVFNFFGIKKSIDYSEETSMIGKIPDEKLFNESWTVYAFEADKSYKRGLYQMKNEIEKYGHNVIVYSGYVAGTYDGEIKFLTGGNVRGHAKLIKNNYVTLPCIDLARLVQEFKAEDFIVIKMHVEGAEMLDLIHKGVLSLIDVMLVSYEESMASKLKDLFNKELTKAQVVKYEWKKSPSNLLMKPSRLWSLTLSPNPYKDHFEPQ